MLLVFLYLNIHIMKGIKMNTKLLSSLIAAIFAVSSFSALAADAMAPAGVASPTGAAMSAKHKPVRHKKEAKKLEKKEEAAESKMEESKETPDEEKKEEHRAPKK
jgi:Rieske Fe-S protein